MIITIQYNIKENNEEDNQGTVKHMRKNLNQMNKRRKNIQESDREQNKWKK